MTYRTTTRTFDAVKTLAAKEGWDYQTDSPWSHWDGTFIRNNERVSVRYRGGRLTDLHATDGSGVIVAPKRDKAEALVGLLIAE